MESRKTTVLENGLIWFGAGVAIPEIITGTYLAPLGFSKGILAIIVGHIIGGLLLLLAGLIGGQTGKSSMETAKMSFGQRGGLIFAVLNIMQLFGWTAIMIYDGALAAGEIFSLGNWVWCGVIGVLIIMCIIVGINNLGKINSFAMVALFVLTLVLSYVIFFKGDAQNVSSEGLSFGAAVELSIAMPLSWLPLISDYTKEAKEPKKATWVSAVTYSCASAWMYIIGMGAAIFTNETNIAQIMLKAGLGVAGLLVVVISTVTTTFLDAWSAGVSAEAISSKISGKAVAIVATIVGVIGGMFLPLHDITEFLYLIGSVFAPMIAILITSYFILKVDFWDSAFSIQNLASWFIGFITYRLIMNQDIIIGYTIPAMLITMIICIVVNKIWATD